MENEPNIIKTADFIIYQDLGLVEVNSKTIRLGPVNMKVLLILVYNCDKVVSRTELFDTVWNNQIISDDALTKCISEIRTKLGKHSNYQSLIVTIPKKGYQWSPSIVKKSSPNPQPQKNFKTYLNSLLLIIISVIVLVISFLWLVNRMTEIKHVPILLLATESYGESNNPYSNSLEDLLRKNILETQSIRFLSKLALLDNPPYSIINRKYNYQVFWMIETKVRKIHANKKRVTLNLIDTRIGLEVYTKSIEIEGNLDKFDEFSLDFFRTIEIKINKY
ncbi:MAG: winged helix-turn-helix domain-containing protein [Proteobacteria bacterium]|nr:winged helix-turn-helix domain-containing protein [Pseudomonadota bacterium]